MENLEYTVWPNLPDKEMLKRPLLLVHAGFYTAFPTQSKEKAEKRKNALIKYHGLEDIGVEIIPRCISGGCFCRS